MAPNSLSKMIGNTLIMVYKYFPHLKKKTTISTSITSKEGQLAVKSNSTSEFKIT